MKIYREKFGRWVPKLIKGTLIFFVLCIAAPMIMIGLICRFARDAVTAGSELYDDVTNWLDR